MVSETGTAAPSFSLGEAFQEPQWMPETMDCTKPRVYYSFSYVPHTYSIHTFSFTGNTAASLWRIRIASITTLVSWGPLLRKMRGT